MMPTTTIDLAHVLRISTADLQQLAEHPPYKIWRIRKKTGRWRELAEPEPRLKQIQNWILRRVLAGFAIHDAAHGCRPGRSTMTNAQVHAGAAAILKFDLRDFFPSIDIERVEWLFKCRGFHGLARTYSLLCTAVIDGFGRRRSLPQGAPTSPAIANASAWNLDCSLSQMAARVGAKYTRYVDDLTFSFDDARADFNEIIHDVGIYVKLNGFALAIEKTALMLPHERQEITGLVVNGGRARPPRAWRRRLRAAIHQAHFGATDSKLAKLQGSAAYLTMSNPTKGRAFLKTIRQMRKKR